MERATYDFNLEKIASLQQAKSNSEEIDKKKLHLLNRLVGKQKIVRNWCCTKFSNLSIK